MNTLKLLAVVVLLATVGIGYDGSFGGSQAFGGEAGEKKPAPKKFVKADTDQDGKLSLAEFTAAHPGEKAGKRFETADADKDGFLTPAELKAARGKKPEKPNKKNK